MYVRFWKKVGGQIFSHCETYCLWDKFYSIIAYSSESNVLSDVFNVMERYVTDEWTEKAEEKIREISPYLSDTFDIRRMS